MPDPENPDTIEGEAHTIEWPPPEDTGDGLDALPGLARIAASATSPTTRFATSAAGAAAFETELETR